MKWTVRSGSVCRTVHATDPVRAMCLAMEHIQVGDCISTIIGATPDGGSEEDEIYMLTSKVCELIGAPIPQDVWDSALSDTVCAEEEISF